MTLPYKFCITNQNSLIDFEVDGDGYRTTWNRENANKAVLWCVKNCKGGYDVKNGYETVVSFETKEDQALFKLFWV